MVTVTQTTTAPTPAILKLRAEGRIAESDLPTEAKMAEVSVPLPRPVGLLTDNSAHT